MTHCENTRVEAEQVVAAKWHKVLARFVLWFVWSIAKCILLVVSLPFMFMLYVVMTIQVEIYTAWEEHEKHRQEKLRRAA
jgi:hypothetical protein